MARRARQKIRKQGQVRILQRTARNVKISSALAKKAAAAISKAASSLISAAAALAGGGVLLVAVCGIAFVAAIAASPFGIFFSGEQQPGAVTPREAIAQINQEYRDSLDELKRGDYDSIEQTGTPPPWRDVLSVFACKTAGADDSTDVTLLDPDRVGRLRNVFWDMTKIDTWVETITHPAQDEGEEPVTEKILHIKITAKTTGEMAVAYSFSGHQQTQLAELLSDENRPLWNRAALRHKRRGQRGDRGRGLIPNRQYGRAGLLELVWL